MKTQKPPTFQDVIQRLHEFWKSQGALLWQPYSEKVGAGTMNPATVLRVLGPEPWNVGYVEPSYRPDDGRYGENPNRMQMHTQYQVILKPDPGNPQEIYLQSLEAIGIDPAEHDIRFVEDNWESPALGAWGLGWEVWLDGLEITQFTYFQQACSQELHPPAVEITYGLERIVMFLQRVRRVWDIDWDGVHTYGDILLQAEIDHCKYNFEIADIDRLREMYRLFEEEAKAAIAAGLVMPAHDYILRCSHTFNVLDARGAIGVTERASYFARMRDLARQVGELYVKQREEAGFPWLRLLPPRELPQVPPLGPVLEQPADFVIEVGTEELPPQDVRAAIEQWSQAVPQLLEQLRLSYEGLRVSATPRRIVAYVTKLAPRQEDRVVEVKGPPAHIAFDAQGRPTKAAEGFARSQGVPVESLQVRSEGKKSYVVAVKREEGRDAGEVLQAALPDLIARLRFTKAMRWNHTDVAFSRPIRWLLALHGERVIPFTYADLVSGRTTRGPRPLGSPTVEIERAEDYLPTMAKHYIIVDRPLRRRRIWAQVEALAKGVGGVVPEDDRLLEEVTDLVEWPVAIRGGFEEKYLRLPKDVLITVMKKHQRYFPIVDPETGEMLPYFIAVSNGERKDMALVRRGYEDVLRARYADAEYFVEQDLRHPLEDFLPKLRTLTFQEELGSMLDKVHRLEALTPKIADALGLSVEEKAWAERAAHLCKADLATSMVIEITSLQGIMGREYARHWGEPEPVAQAIYEHYLPRFAGDELPQTKPGIVLAIADRLDSLVGLFAVGLKPTGSADPYGLRRAALGLVHILIGRRIPFDLRRHLKEAARLQPVPVTEATLDEVWQFIVDRLKVWMRDQGLRHDVVEATVAERGNDPYAAYRAAIALEAAVQEPDWQDILVAYARAKRIVRNIDEIYPLDERYLTEPAARELYEAWRRAKERLEQDPEVPTLVEVLRELKEPINRFFTDILVMAEDPQVRQARLALVQRVAALPDGIADLSKLQGF